MEKEREEKRVVRKTERVMWKSERVAFPKRYCIYNSNGTKSTGTMWESGFVRTAMKKDANLLFLRFEFG